MANKNNKSLWNLAITRGGEIEKSELFEILYFLRQAIALVFGIVWGFASMQGVSSMLIFSVVTTIFIYIYCTKYLEVDAEEIGPFDIISEGFFPSFTFFLLIWICTHSVLHF